MIFNNYIQLTINDQNAKMATCFISFYFNFFRVPCNARSIKRRAIHMSRHFHLTASDSGQSIQSLLEKNKKVMHNRAKLFAYYLDGREGLDKLVLLHNNMHLLLEDVMSLGEHDALAEDVIRLIDAVYQENPTAKRFNESALPKAVAKQRLEHSDEEIDGVVSCDLRDKKKFQKRVDSEGDKTATTDVGVGSAVTYISLPFYHDLAKRALEISADKTRALNAFSSREKLPQTLTPLDKLKIIIVDFFESETKLADLANRKINAILHWIQLRAMIPNSKTVDQYVEEIGQFLNQIGMHAIAQIYIVLIPEIKKLDKLINNIDKQDKVLKKSHRGRCTLTAKEQKEIFGINTLTLISEFYSSLDNIAKAFLLNPVSACSQAQSYDSSDDDSSNDEMSSSKDSIATKVLLTVSNNSANFRRIADHHEAIRDIILRQIFGKRIYDSTAENVIEYCSLLTKKIFEIYGYERCIAHLKWNEEMTLRHADRLGLAHEEIAVVFRSIESKEREMQLIQLIQKQHRMITELQVESREMKAAITQMSYQLNQLASNTTLHSSTAQQPEDKQASSPAVSFFKT